MTQNSGTNPAHTIMNLKEMREKPKLFVSKQLEQQTKYKVYQLLYENADRHNQWFKTEQKQLMKNLVNTTKEKK